MTRKGATSSRVNYLVVIDQFLNDKLRKRINAQAYSAETVKVLEALEWELIELINAQRFINRKAKDVYVRERCADT